MQNKLVVVLLSVLVSAVASSCWGCSAGNIQFGAVAAVSQLMAEFGRPAAEVGETVLLLHPPLPLVGVSIVEGEGVSAK